MSIRLLALLALPLSACLNNETSATRTADPKNSGPVYLFDSSVDSSLISNEGWSFLNGISGLPQVRRYAVATINWDAFTKARLLETDSSLTINLFPDVDVVARKFDVDGDSGAEGNRELWQGIDGSDSSSYLRLAKYSDGIFLYLTYPNTKPAILYAIYRIGNGIHVILDVDKTQTEPGDFYSEHLSPASM